MGYTLVCITPYGKTGTKGSCMITIEFVIQELRGQTFPVNTKLGIYSSNYKLGISDLGIRFLVCV